MPQTEYDAMYGTKAEREAAEASLAEFNACSHDWQWRHDPEDWFSPDPYEMCSRCGGARIRPNNAPD